MNQLWKMEEARWMTRREENSRIKRPILLLSFYRRTLIFQSQFILQPKLIQNMPISSCAYNVDAVAPTNIHYRNTGSRDRCRTKSVDNGYKFAEYFPTENMIDEALNIAVNKTDSYLDQIREQDKASNDANLRRRRELLLDNADRLKSKLEAHRLLQMQDQLKNEIDDDSASCGCDSDGSSDIDE